MLLGSIFKSINDFDSNSIGIAAGILSTVFLAFYLVVSYSKINFNKILLKNKFKLKQIEENGKKFNLNAFKLFFYQIPLSTVFLVFYDCLPLYESFFDKNGILDLNRSYMEWVRSFKLLYSKIKINA